MNDLDYSNGFCPKTKLAEYSIDSYIEVFTQHTKSIKLTLSTSQRYHISRYKKGSCDDEYWLTITNKNVTIFTTKIYFEIFSVSKRNLVPRPQSLRSSWSALRNLSDRTPSRVMENCSSIKSIRLLKSA